GERPTGKCGKRLLRGIAAALAAQDRISNVRRWILMVSRIQRLVLIISVLGLGNLAGAAQPAPDGVLEIDFIDVQGGAATLVVTPLGESVLIDSGWPGLNDRDPKRIYHVLKDLAKRDRLDHLITTHWHTDHYGGVAGLAKMIPIDQFWDRGLPGDPGAR